jgi:dihydropyrimidinase
VLGDRLSLERFVAVTATEPAKIFGIHPQKGTIVVGADADLVVWDPAATRTVRAADGQSRSDYSPYEGRSVTGWPRHTIRRGTFVYRDGQIVDGPSRGVRVRSRRDAT